MLRKIGLGAVAVLIVVIGFMVINNANWFESRAPGEPELLAHRGVAQRYSTEGLTGETCTAAQMIPSNHDYLENTLASMAASIAAGADVIELDVHPTTDGQFAVFHDWTVDCRTEGKGITREQSMAYLKTLDIGHGYTADGGKTFPFRGKGVGLMPTLAEVMDRFGGQPMLINIKSNDPEEGRALAAYLATLPEAVRGVIMVYGGDRPIGTLKQALPDLRTMSRKAMVDCLVKYIGYGWTGLMPETCRDTIVLVPLNFAPWAWGWPDKFLNRMEAAGSKVYVIGPWSGGNFTTGVDTLDELNQLPEGYSAGIWTNEIELIGAAVKGE